MGPPSFVGGARDEWAVPSTISWLSENAADGKGDAGRNVNDGCSGQYSGSAIAQGSAG